MILRNIIAYTILPLIMLFIGVIGIVYPEKVNESQGRIMHKTIFILVVKMQFMWYNIVVKMQEVIACYSEKRIKI